MLGLGKRAAVKTKAVIVETYPQWDRAKDRMGFAWKLVVDGKFIADSGNIYPRSTRSMAELEALDVLDALGTASRKAYTVEFRHFDSYEESGIYSLEELANRV